MLPLFVNIFNLGVHNVFVNLGYESDYEVQDDDELENNTQEPNNVNKEDIDTTPLVSNHRGSEWWIYDVPDWVSKRNEEECYELI